MRLTLIHNILLEFELVIIILDGVSIVVLLERNLLLILLLPANRLVGLLDVLLLILLLLAHLLLIRIAFHIVMQCADGQLRTTHERVLVIAYDWLCT